MFLDINLIILCKKNGERSWDYDALVKLKIFFIKLFSNSFSNIDINFYDYYINVSNDNIIEYGSIYMEQNFFRNNLKKNIRDNKNKIFNFYLLTSIENNTAGFYNSREKYGIIARKVFYTKYNLYNYDIKHKSIVLYHEFGHACGLKHISEEDNIMSVINIYGDYNFKRKYLNQVQKKIILNYLK